MNLDYVGNPYTHVQGMNPTVICYLEHLYENFKQFPSIYNIQNNRRQTFEDMLDERGDYFLNNIHTNVQPEHDHRIFYDYVNEMCDRYNRILDPTDNGQIIFTDEIEDTIENIALHFLSYYWRENPPFTFNPNNYCKNVYDIQNFPLSCQFNQGNTNHIFLEIREYINRYFSQDNDDDKQDIYHGIILELDILKTRIIEHADSLKFLEINNTRYFGSMTPQYLCFQLDTIWAPGVPTEYLSFLMTRRMDNDRYGWLWCNSKIPNETNNNNNNNNYLFEDEYNALLNKYNPQSMDGQTIEQQYKNGRFPSGTQAQTIKSLLAFKETELNDLQQEEDNDVVMVNNNNNNNLSPPRKTNNATKNTPPTNKKSAKNQQETSNEEVLVRDKVTKDGNFDTKKSGVMNDYREIAKNIIEGYYQDKDGATIDDVREGATALMANDEQRQREAAFIDAIRLQQQQRNQRENNNMQLNERNFDQIFEFIRPKSEVEGNDGGMDIEENNNEPVVESKDGGMDIEEGESQVLSQGESQGESQGQFFDQSLSTMEFSLADESQAKDGNYSSADSVQSVDSNVSMRGGRKTRRKKKRGRKKKTIKKKKKQSRKKKKGGKKKKTRKNKYYFKDYLKKTYYFKDYI